MIRLYHVPQSRSMRVLWLLYELGVPFELELRAFDKSLRDEDFRALSPAGRVPALEIDGGCMFESLAMMEYLCERFPEAGLGRAPGTQERRGWLSWLQFSETISQHVAALTQQHLMLHEDHMRSPIVMRLEAKRLEKCYAALEARLAETGSGALLVSGFSACDIAVGQAVYMARHFAPVEGFAAVSDWYAGITAREAFRRSLPGEGARLYGAAFYPAWDG
ncbi:glutathione S-transferase family protein [Salipiger sp. P9]|uniref:glutathione S-transferase family protein n=1 Tax=Salipiger pentaromativorans TaxID=2943193 RepID=UPI002157A5D2|nr:glutathione S-transferase family protein [Salipiger pentaromativorans]MCR8546277.1 glutathione S-transferase family protein [Salipiger pentaromativorans]